MSSVSAASAASIGRYRRALASGPLRRALLLGVLLRMPVFASGVVLTVHIVSTLGRSYAAAGIAAAVSTVAIALTGPFRGRLLDRVGVRRLVFPALVVGGFCWSIAPFTSFLPLVALAAVAGLCATPTFSIVRQAVIAAVDDRDRRTAISLDGVALELSFMASPALAVWAASRWPTEWVLFTIQMLAVVGAVALWVINPRLKQPAAEALPVSHAARSSWFRLPFLAVCAAAAAATIVLAGTDISVVAALRSFGQQSSIGIVLAVSGLGSIIGGLVYGGLHRSISPFWLLGALAVATAPLALATGVWSMLPIAFVGGLFIAPTMTASVDQASRLVPMAARGEAMGWHGSSMTAGSALGAPLAGFAIDRYGSSGGFVSVAVVGAAVAVVGTLAGDARRRHRRAVAVRAPVPTGEVKPG